MSKPDYDWPAMKNWAEQILDPILQEWLKTVSQPNILLYIYHQYDHARRLYIAREVVNQKDKSIVIPWQHEQRLVGILRDQDLNILNTLYTNLNPYTKAVENQPAKLYIPEKMKEETKEQGFIYEKSLYIGVNKNAFELKQKN